MHLLGVIGAAMAAVLLAGAGAPKAPSAKALRAQAAKAERDLGGLSRQLIAAGERRAEAERRQADIEARLALLEAREVEARAAYARSRAGLEAALAGLSLVERRNESDQKDALALSALSGGLANHVRAARTASAEAQSLRLALDAERNALKVSSTALDRDRAAIEDLIAEKTRLREALLRDAGEAERRAKARAARAKTLAALADRKPTSKAAVAGPPIRWRAPIVGAIARVDAKRQTAKFDGRPGGLVVAPAQGVVSYAGLFRTYGQVLILEGADGYVFILTGLGRIYAATGQSVLAGEPLGDLPDADRPRLGLEIRRNGKTIETTRWLKDEIKPRKAVSITER